MVAMMIGGEDRIHVLYQRPAWRDPVFEAWAEDLARRRSRDDLRIERAEALTVSALRDDVMRGRPVKPPLRREYWRKSQPKGGSGGWRTRVA